MINYLVDKLLHSPMNYVLFNNTLSPRLNFRYLYHSLHCRSVYRKLNQANNLQSRYGEWLKKHPLVRIEEVLSRNDALSISSKIGKLIEDPTNVYKESTIDNYISIKNPVTNLDAKLLTIFENPQLNQAIEEHFGSYYRLAWLDCYRSVPTSKTATSWLWHSDNVPCRTLKMMLLLTDTTEETGAMRLLPKSTTNLYRKYGYFGDKVASRVESLSDLSQKYKLPLDIYLAEGKAGDIVLFDNNNLHQAVAPLRGFRDALTYLIVPSKIPFKEDLEKRGIAGVESKPGGYPSRLLE